LSTFVACPIRTIDIVRDRQDVSCTFGGDRRRSIRRTFSILTDANNIVYGQYKRRAKELLDLNIYPVGSFSMDQYKQAEGVLDFLKRKNQKAFQEKGDFTTGSESEDIRDAMALLQRLVHEAAVTQPPNRRGQTSNCKNQDDVHRPQDRRFPAPPFFCNPRYYAPIIDRWRQAAIYGYDNVMLPNEVILELRQMNRILPAFQYDAHIMGIVLDVIVKTSEPSKAPILAERFLKATQEEATKRRNKRLQPNAVWYSLLAQAWVISGLPEAPQKIEALIQTWPSSLDNNNNRHINNTFEQRSNLVPYNILLRLWASRGSVHQMERTLTQIQERGWDLDMVSCLAAVHGYSKAGMIEKAESMLSKMISLMQPSQEQHAFAIGKAVKDLLLAYRDKVSAFMQSERVKSEAAQRAQRWYRQVQELGILDRRRQNVLQGIMRDMLIQAGMCKEALDITSLPKTYNTIELTVLLKTYGKNGMAA
jgi:pentatricopeptide repeat protein